MTPQERWSPPADEGWIEGQESDDYMYAEEALTEERNIEILRCWDSRTGKRTYWWRSA